MKDVPLVSIIVRTCGQPHILRNALKSIQKQTYGNIEVILVEDGRNISESLLREFPELNIRYYAMGKKYGRTIAGNRGLEMAQGRYLNFLDDDDLLLPEHVSVLVEYLDKTGFRAAYAVGEERQILRKNDGSFQTRRKLIRYRYPFNRMLLFYMNYIPIQSILFERSLYEQCGGFDEELDILEDWDMWVRYATVCDFGFVDQVTSVYFTPFRGRTKKNRDVEMRAAEERLKEKHDTYIMRLSVTQVNRDVDYILNRFNQKNFIFYMRKIRNWLLYRDR